MALSQQDLQAFWATAPQPKQQKKKGNLLTSLIPTGGGIAGGAAGAAIGTALGGPLGTLLGAGLGSAIGGGGGKVAENAVEGNKLSSGVAGEAAISGLLGAGPLRAGKAVVDTVKGVKAGTSLADAIVNAGQNATKMSVTKAAGDKLQDAGQKLIAKEFRLNPTQQADFRKVHGEEAVSVLRRYGIKKPEDVAAKLQPLQQAFDDAIGNIPAIDQMTLKAGLAKVYGPLLKSPILLKQNLGQSIKTQADELVKLAQSGDLPASRLNDLRKEFDAAVRYTQKGAPEYNAIKETADALRTTLQSAADKAGVKTAEGTSLKNVGRELSKLYKLDDVVGKQSYLGSGNLPVSLGNTPGTVIGAATGPVGAAAGFVGNAVVNSPTGRRVLANGALKTGEKLSEKGASSNPFGIAPIAARVGTGGLAGALVDQLSRNSAQNPTTTTTNTNMPSTANITSSYQTNDNVSSPFAPQNLESAIQKILENGGTLEDASKFVSLAETVQKLQSMGQQGQKLNATQLQQANNAQSGLDSLNTIRQTLSSNPNAAKLSSLPGGSFTQSLTGTGEYSAAINNATDVIGRLRSGGAINADEEKRFRSLLPGSFDSPETVDYKLSALADLFGRFIDPQSAQPDTTDLVSALMAAQGMY